MSQIPSGISRLKTPSKIVKPVQAGGVSGGTSPTQTPLAKPRGATTSSSSHVASTAQPRASVSGSKLSQTASGPVKRGAHHEHASENSGRSSTSGSRERLVSPRGSVSGPTAGPQVTQPRPPSREHSQTRLQYRRESSSSSLRGASSKTESFHHSARRRSEISRTPESQGSELPKTSLLNLFKIGDRVLVGNVNPGVIAFIGETRFAKGDWAGVVLDEPVGKNNGSVQGLRYFECQPGHGIFTRIEKLTKINQIVGDRQQMSTSEPTDHATELELKIGDRVVVSGSKHGVVRYVGETGFAKGKWAGVELDEPLGKNDGAVAGTRYFQCEPTYGLFAPLYKIAISSLPRPARHQIQLPQENDSQNSLSAFGSTSSLSSVNSTQSGSSATPKTASTSTTQNVSTPEAELSEVKSSAGQPPPSPGLSTSQLVALQEALEDREKQIQSLLAEREFEQAEVANATSQVAKVEEEVGRLKEIHAEVLVEKNRAIEELQALVEVKERDKVDLQTQLDEERRKVEDLQFKLEEEEITLGDELKIEQKEIETLEIELKEKVTSLWKLKKDLEVEQDGKKTALCKVAELENEVVECNSQLCSSQKALAESNIKIRELETTLSCKLEEQLVVARFKEEEVKKNCRAIASLEKDLEEQNKANRELENELTTTKSELVKLKEENDCLQKSVNELTDKLHAKEDEFSTLCSELHVIKDTTLELQRQLHLSEMKSENLTADKNKLESEIAVLEKSSGDNSQKLVYLNEQLREKDRVIDTLKSSTAESQVKIGMLSEELMQAKKSELKESLQKEDNLMATHQTKLQALSQAKDKEILAVTKEMKQQTEKVNALMGEMLEIKAAKEEVTKEKKVLEVQQSKLASDYQAAIQELSAVQVQLKAALQATEASGGAEEEYNNLAEKYSKLDKDYQKLVLTNKDLVQGNGETAEKYEQLYKDKKSIERDKLEVEAKLQQETNQVVALEKQVEAAKHAASSTHQQLHLMRSSLSDAETMILKLNCQVKDAVTEKEKLTESLNSVREDKDILQKSVDTLQADNAELKTEKKKLIEEMEKTKSQFHDLHSQLRESEIRETSAERAADSEREILKGSLEDSNSTLKHQQEEIARLKKEIEKLANSGSDPVTEYTEPLKADMGVLVSKLSETEDMLAAIEAEKYSAEAQVNFLNSVIVDLQRKNEENEKTIEMLVTGNVPNTNGTISDDDEPVRPGLKQRLFCDICDIFDAHDTDDCPTQSSGILESQGTQYHGNRNEERPYCDTCEMFGHWTQECDDEETF